MAADKGLRKVKSGLERLAFGNVADAVALLYLEDAPPPEKLAKLDFFHVAELKRGKNGVEMKFFDRLKAMEALARLAESQSRGDGALPFYSAILESAAEQEERGE